MENSPSFNDVVPTFKIPHSGSPCISFLPFISNERILWPLLIIPSVGYHGRISLIPATEWTETCREFSGEGTHPGIHSKYLPVSTFDGAVAPLRKDIIFNHRNERRWMIFMTYFAISTQIGATKHSWGIKWDHQTKWTQKINWSYNKINTPK